MLCGSARAAIENRRSALHDAGRSCLMHLERSHPVFSLEASGRDDFVLQLREAQGVVLHLPHPPHLVVSPAADAVPAVTPSAGGHAAATESSILVAATGVTGST